MDASARRVLKSNKGEIIQNLILEDGILDELEQEDILTENMAYKIKAKVTNEEKISELLFILPRRGPRAFETFVEATKKNYSFLAEMLEEAFQKELEKGDDFKSRPNEHIPHSSDVSMETLSDRSSPEVNHDQHHHDYTETDGLDLTVRSLASDKSLCAAGVQQSLNNLYGKLKSHMTNSSLRELSFKSPVPVTFRMVDDLVDDLLKSQNKCYSILGHRDKSISLFSLIHHMMERNKTLEAELRSTEEMKNKYAHHITKLENKCRDSNALTDNKRKDNAKLSTQIKKLENENTGLKKKINHMDETHQAMRLEFEKFSEEYKKQTYGYECRIRDLEVLIAQYSKELNKPINMYVTGKSPIRENRWRNDSTPFHSVQYNNKHNPALDVNYLRAKHKLDEASHVVSVQNTDKTFNTVHAPITLITDNGINPNITNNDDILQERQNMVHKIHEGGEHEEQNDHYHKSMHMDRKGRGRKTQVAPHMTMLHPDISRARQAGTVGPSALQGLQITNSSKPCKPVISTASLSPRAKPCQGKASRNGNVTKK